MFDKKKFFLFRFIKMEISNEHDTKISFPECVSMENFLQFYNFHISISSQGEKYILLNISFIIDSNRPFLIIPQSNWTQTWKMYNTDYSINKRFVVIYEPSTFMRLSFECLEKLRESCKLFINKYIKQTATCKSVDVIADEGVNRAYLIFPINGIKFLLADDYDQFDLIRTSVMTKREGYEHLRRSVYSFNPASIELFENVNRAKYNTIVLDHLDILPFKCQFTSILITKGISHYTVNDIINHVVLFVPNDAIIIGNLGNLPYVWYQSIVFPKRILIDTTKSFELMGQFYLNGEFMGSFPLIVKFQDFAIYFYADRFDIVPYNNKSIIIEKTKLVLPFHTMVKHQLAFSCLLCNNYHDHYRQCSSSNSKMSIPTKCRPFITRYTWAAILVRDFKDSANLVRSGSMSILDAIAKLSNVVMVKYCNKYSKIDPYVFVKAFTLYQALACPVKEIATFMDFLKIFDSLPDTCKSYFINLANGKQIDIFETIIFSEEIQEPDRQFVYFGLNHNIKRFVGIVKSLSSIFLLPERCPIEILYDGLSVHGLINVLALMFIPKDTNYSDETEHFFECDKWGAVKPIKECKDFLNSKTPFCEHEPLEGFIKEKCNHCVIISNFHALALESLMTTFGLRFEDVIPKIIPRIERSNMIIPILVKPNGLKGNNLNIIVNALLKLDKSITIDACTKPSIIPFQMFEELYPAAAGGKRKFSKHWHAYMTSDVITVIFLRAPNLEIVRTAMLEARKTSNIEWTKNIVHSAENDDELDLFFDEIAKLDLDIICEPLAYFDGTRATLANRKLESNKH